MQPNNQIIDKPGYYTLADGTQLEDAMMDYRLNGPEWAACEKLFRKGKKAGEPPERDAGKADHFFRFLARRNGTSYSAECTRIYSILDRIVTEHGGVRK